MRHLSMTASIQTHTEQNGSGKFCPNPSESPSTHRSQLQPETAWNFHLPEVSHLEHRPDEDLYPPATFMLFGTVY